MESLRIFLLAALFLVVFGANNGSTETGPVAHWSFDEEDGTIAYDSSENDHNGALENGPVWVDGVSNGALEFDGTDDYIEVSDNDSLDLGTGSFTIASWVNVADCSDNCQIVKKGHNNKIELEINNYIAKGVVTGNDYVESSFSFSQSEWYFLVFIRDETSLKMYVNGDLDSTESVESPANVGNNEDLHIGKDSAYGQYFDGIIDDVTIWGRALSSEEILELYTDGGYEESTPDLAEGETEGELWIPSVSLISSIAAIGIIALRRRY